MRKAQLLRWILGFVLAMCSANLRAATPPQLVGPSPENEAIIVRLPDDELKIFFVKRPEASAIFSISSKDNGQTWGEPTSELALPGKAYYALQVAVDQTGELQLVFHIAGEGPKGYKGRQYDLYHARTSNGRREWSTPARFFEGYVGSMRGFVCTSSGQLVYPAGVAVPERVAAASPERDLGWNDVRVFLSDNRGETWSTATRDLSVIQDNTRGKTRYGAIEPCIVELRDHSLWMLIRTKNGTLYESRSSDCGTTWTEPTPSCFTSSDSPAAVVRCADGRLVVFFNQCQRWDDPMSYAIGGREVLHAAISVDEGKTWHGAREILHDEGGDAKRDRGTSYTSAVQAADGKLIVVSGQGEGRQKILRIDPDWLLETGRRDDFGDGVQQWTAIEGAPLRTIDIEDGPKAIALRQNESKKPVVASWNFPASLRGELRLRLRLHAPCDGATLTLTDHYSVASDARADDHGVAMVTIDSAGKMLDGVLKDGWNDVALRWDAATRRVTVDLNGMPIGSTPMTRVPTIGVNYLRVSVRTPGKDGGIDIARAEAAAITSPTTQPATRPSTSPTRIAFLGDSITKGERPARGIYGAVAANESFVARLCAKFAAAGASVVLENDGVPSERTDLALQRIDPILATRPDIVVIMFGTNDACIDVNKTAPRVDLAAYEQNLRELIERVRKSGAQPILMTQPPLGEEFAKNRNPVYLERGVNFETEVYVEVVRRVAHELQVPIVDHYERWSALGSERFNALLLDGCHPNATGHELMADAIFEALSKIVPHTSPATQRAD